jgi:hypothetical protein
MNPARREAAWGHGKKTGWRRHAKSTKSEMRNPKQIQNLNDPMTQTKEGNSPDGSLGHSGFRVFSCLGHLDLLPSIIVSDFEFRISDLADSDVPGAL